MKVSEIAAIIKACDCRLSSPEAEVGRLLTDSRRLEEPQDTLFFAIVSARNSGANYIPELYRAGVRSFVVPNGCEVNLADVNVWHVDDVVEALQRMAECHRKKFECPVVGVTGSNGKTVVKDWLVQLLSREGHVAASPKSYNSQIGVPLSVWQMKQGDRLAIFEAGISQPGEMCRLEKVIRPTIGILTNIGQAHDENFRSRRQKITEKLQLFAHCETIVYCSDHKDVNEAISGEKSLCHARCFTWGSSSDDDVCLLSSEVMAGKTRMRVSVRQQAPEDVYIPFVDKASRENAMHCLATMVLLGYGMDTVSDRLMSLAPVEMRLELNEAVGNSLLINDSYSLDINSLTIALDYLNQVRQGPDRTLIISDIMQTGIPDDVLYAQVAELVRRKGVTRLIGIGETIGKHAYCFNGMESMFFLSTQEFIDTCDMSLLAGQTILLKGARRYAFERIAKILQRKNHETVMEVNLDALVHNLNYYRSKLNTGTKLMAMVKAASYGAGRVEVAATLQFNHVDYLTVAYADEGVELRRSGITLPIMVMNPEEASFDDIIRYRLEPDIYSFRILSLFAEKLKGASSEVNLPFPIHVEFDTGMHRLGFVGEDKDRLLGCIAAEKNNLVVKSVFTHLACADDPGMDAVTHRQIALFRQWSDGLPGIKHILNSSGIERFPEAQMDMVRLGIGLYGISPVPEVQSHLRQVSRLVSRISQIKDIPEGDTVGYGGRWKAGRPSRIAIIPIGYADGLHRGLGYCRGHVSIAGQEAQIVGTVCMDMCFVDVTDIECREGDRAVLFGIGDLLQRNAAAAGTISYELLTAVSPRVKRIYYHEE